MAYLQKRRNPHWLCAGKTSNSIISKSYFLAVMLRLSLGAKFKSFCCCCCALVRQVNARENALYLFFSFLVPTIGPFATTTTIGFDDSKMNFIDVSFERNLAIFSGGHGKFNDAV